MMTRYSSYGPWRAGDEVWACAYQFDTLGTKLIFHQTPIKGILSVTDVPSDKYDIPPKTPNIPRYFVPYKKNDPTKLAWSRAVNYSSRIYADTEAESITRYNEQIQARINWLREQEQRCLNDLIITDITKAGEKT